MTRRGFKFGLRAFFLTEDFDGIAVGDFLKYS